MSAGSAAFPESGAGSMCDFDDLIGKPFADGGRGPDAFDCFGLHLEIRRRLGLPCPDYHISALAAARVAALIEAEAASTWRWQPVPPEPYALMVMKNGPVYKAHVATYMGDGRFLHITRRMPAAYGRINDPAWRRRIVGYYRYVG